MRSGAHLLDWGWMATEKILVVDDSDEWTELIRVWLQHAGYADLYFARTGKEAVALARKAVPDCILLDLSLPDMDGMELCRAIRAMPALGRVPVVMITAHRKEKIQGLECGADYFIQKAENPAELLATLKAVFRRGELDQGLARKGDLALNLVNRKVFFRDFPVATLTPKTFDLFYVLVERGPEPVRKDILFKAVEGKDQPELSRALEILMNRLRKLLPVELQKRIKAVKGFGYVYIPSDPPKPASVPRQR